MRLIRIFQVATVLMAVAGLVGAAMLASGTIDTNAGTGTAGYSGDGGPATSAALDTPYAVAVAADGDIYIADQGNEVVRRIDGATGDISTVAGGGTIVVGDGSAATAAYLDTPRDAVVDSFGNTFIADAGHHRIRKVNGATGLISTVAGTGTAGYSGDGGLATAAEVDTPTALCLGGGGGFGYDAVYASASTEDLAKGQFATKATLSVTLEITNISVYIQRAIAGKFAFGVYTDSGGEPGALLAESAYTLVAAGTDWVTLSLPATTLSPGTYWLAVGVERSDVYYFDDGVGQTRHNAFDAKSGMQANWGGTTLSASRRISMYATASSGVEVFFTDAGNHVVRKFEDGGTISTIAGTGTAGYSGDGGAATAATLSDPRGLARDSDVGDLYVADTGNHAVRRFTDGGTISTVAGTGTAGFSGDGGAATAATLDSPSDVTVAPGPQVDFGFTTAFGSTTSEDFDKKSIATQVTLSAGGTLTSISAYLDMNQPKLTRFGLFTDAAGEPGALIVETEKLTAPAGIGWTTFATPSTSVSAGTYWLALAGTKEMEYVYDAAGGQTRHSSDDPNNGFAANWGNTYESSTRRISIYATLSKTDLIVADTNNHRVRRLTLDDTIDTIAGTGTAGFSGDGGAATAAQIDGPAGVAIDAAGDIYIGDQNNHRIRRIDDATGVISTWGGTGTAGYSGDGGLATSAEMNAPWGLFIDGSDHLYLADSANHVIRRIDASTQVITLVAGSAGLTADLGDGGLATDAVLGLIEDIALDSGENLYIACTGQGRVRKVDAGTSIITSIIGTGTEYAPADPADDVMLTQPAALAIDASGDVYVVDRSSSNCRVVKLDVSASTYSTVAGDGTAGFSGDGWLATSAQIDQAAGIFVDSSGHLYIADTGNHRIRRVDAGTLFIDTIAGTGTQGYTGDDGDALLADLDSPHQLVVQSDGSVHFAGTGNHVVRKIDTDGIITTFAGDGTAGYSGDGGPATDAQLNSARGVVTGTGGGRYLYVADALNHRVRFVPMGSRIVRWQEVQPAN